MAYDIAQSFVLRYCDTSFGWHTNRQSVVVRYDPDPEEAPHVVLQSPNTVFVNDDDDAHAGTNDFNSTCLKAFVTNKQWEKGSESIKEGVYVICRGKQIW